ncbi:c-type cytochrome [Dyella humicola]|uniref:c-type cytochrome n=1 Tax=Dyella humicola TaxID=2992126 RepID=UPI003CE46FEB
MPATIHPGASTSSSKSQRLATLSASAGGPLGGLLLSLLCFSAHATPPANASTSSAMPEAVQVCSACHGVGGAGNASGIPRIAGMNVDYLAHTLAAFKTGSRHSDTMQPIARTLSDPDIDALAKYFAAQQPPLAPSPTHPRLTWLPLARRWRSRVTTEAFPPVSAVMQRMGEVTVSAIQA